MASAGWQTSALCRDIVVMLNSRRALLVSGSGHELIMCRHEFITLFGGPGGAIQLTEAMIGLAGQRSLYGIA